MKHKTILTLAILLVTLFAISAVSANENVTDEIVSVDDAKVNLTTDNVNPGTFEELSQEIDSKISGGRVDFYNDYEGSKNIIVDKDLTIDGHGYCLNANSKSGIFEIKDCNVILKNINFINGKSNEFGGAIYLSLGSNLTIINSTFTNCFAECGGAIYLEGNSTLNITDSEFTDNKANILGGAISIWNGCDVSLTRTDFNNNTATHESGGAVMCLFSNLTADTIEVNDCTSEFGGAITLLSSNATITHSSFRKNRARYDGGAIFSMYELLDLNDNEFINNTANRASAVYSSLNDLIITNNQFISNTDENIGVIYAMNATGLVNRSNTFRGNTGAEIFEAINDDLTMTAGVYGQFKYKYNYNGTLPSYYSLIDDKLVTPVKNQGADGNCWAFAAMGALESCILKVSNITLDLSEANLKNLMAMFSDYGFKILTNDGGNYKMASGYFASWLGPVLDSDDIYYENDFLSPILNSILHVQNIIYFNRTGYLDNYDIKEAILKYGAVSTGIYYNDTYFNKQYNSYYYDGDKGGNHAVCIVGWDDSYSKSNFNNDPSGDGAWIVRNSWGPGWADKGYFYVSYYDTRCAQLNELESYTFILNDTRVLDRIYQYEIQSTSFNNMQDNNVRYKNIFTVEGDEFLAGVSTYFGAKCDYTVEIYINDDSGNPIITKNGESEMGYYTINLDNLLYLNKGDKVSVVFDCNFKGDEGKLPLSYQNESVNLQIQNCVSYLWDGNRWFDLYEEWKAVACIKMFTTFSQENKIYPYFDFTCEGNYLDNSFLINFLIPDDATGVINITAGNYKYSIDVSKTKSIKLYNITSNNNTLSFIYSGDEVYLQRTASCVVDPDISEFEPSEELLKLIQQNNVLDLNMNYIFDSNMANGIVLRHEITIDGHGHVISGANLASIFNIQADNVVLKDIIFTDCSGENGGVIQVYGDNCQIINCLFINNVASKWAGAIYWIGDNGTIKDSNFENNSATYGGAVLLVNNTLVINSVFENNHAITGGGAIYTSGNNCNISDSKFINNKAKDYSGGAIYLYGNQFSFLNNTFVDNTALYYGGAIFVSSNKTQLSNCLFKNNVASKYGGAVYWYANDGVLFNSTFDDNSASYGGAVLWDGANGKLINSTFINTLGNTPIYWDNENSGTIEGSRFLITTTNNVRKGGADFIKNTISLTSNVYSVDYNSPEGALIKFNVVEGVPLTLTFTISGKTSQITLQNDTAILLSEIAGAQPGNIGVAVKFDGDDNYDPFTGAFTLKVEKAKTSLVLECLNTTLNHQITLNAKVLDSFNQQVNEGTVTFKIGATTIATAEVKKGVATASYTPTSSGDISITASFTATNYESSQDSQNIFVDSVIVKVIDAQGTVGETTRLTAHVSDLKGAMTAGSVTFYVNGKEAGKSAVDNGSATVSYVPSAAGNLTVRAVYENAELGTFEGTGIIIVAKADSKTLIDEFNATYSLSSQITVHVHGINLADDGSVSFYENDKLIGTADVKNGVATFTYSPGAYGEVTIKAIYNSDNYLSSNDTYKVLVDSAIVKASDAHSTVGVSTTLNATVSAVYGTITDGSVSFYVNGEFVGKADVGNGMASIAYVPSTAGTLTVRAVYESARYGSVNGTSHLTVDKAKSQIALDTLTPTAGIASQLRAQVGASNIIVNDGTVSFYEDGKIIGTAGVGNGVATIAYTAKSSGRHNISAVFTSPNYDSSSASIMVDVKKAATSLDVNGVFIVNYQDNVRFTVTVKSNNMNVTEGSVKVFVGETLIGTGSVLDGSAEFTLTAESVGSFDLRIVYDETANYLASSALKTLTVNKLSTKITADSITVVYNNAGVLTVSLMDAHGKALSGESVTVDLNGARTFTTDSNGQVKVSTVGLAPKTYTVAVTFQGSDKYSKSTATGSVVVVKATPKLTAGKKTFKRKVKTKKYTVTLLTHQNKALAKVKLTLKVNGKTYSANTNAKGKATFKIKKLTKKGTYKSVVSFNGNAFYNKLTKTVKITVK